jgi:WD40 repeat protein
MTTAQLEEPNALRTNVHASPSPIRVWDVATSQEVASLDAPDSGVDQLDWSRDGRFVVAALSDHSVTVWEWPSRSVALRVIPPAGSAPFLCARFSPDGRKLAICSRGTLLLLSID